ncbi:FliM/FliN family flagellar motor C-terminal domain-containing protein [Novosphingopyxis sp.]|uniref:FliM/FliN family flagellar motor C-terminal domain-containing protein n=1 Tax=Novosphingopyxis sp. TaxID=2709690 RepID=UPI003B5A864B
MTAAEPWLPPSAIDPQRLDDIVSAVSARWSAKWFRSSAVAPTPLQPVTDLPQDCDTRWGLDGGALWIGLVSGTFEAMASALLGEPVTDSRLRDDDRELVRKLADRCRADLMVSLAEAFGYDTAEPWKSGAVRTGSDCHGCDLNWQNGKMFARLAVAGNLFVRLTKARLPRPAARPSLAAMDEALDDQTVRLSGRLGTAKLTLAQAEALHPGDVILLGKAMDEPLDLLLDGVPIAHSRCRIGGDERRLALELTGTLP